MKLKNLGVVLLLMMLVVSGCGKGSTYKAVPDEKVITSEKDLKGTYTDWTRRLDGLKQQTDTCYKDWVDGRTDFDTFYTKAGKIYDEVKKLNQETDLDTEIDLKGTDQQKANAEALKKAYNKTSKQLNDFLYQVPKLKDDKIKQKYDELINGGYNTNMKELKTLLGIQ